MSPIRDLHSLWLDLTHGKPVSQELDHDSHREAVSKHGITEIGIERTGGEGLGPGFLAIIQADGMVFYEGRYGVPLIGEYKGVAAYGRFDGLAELAEEIQFFNLPDGYYYPMTCCPFVYIYVKKGDRQKVIQNYAGAGPRVLWAFEQLIDDVIKETLERSIPCLPRKGLSRR